MSKILIIPDVHLKLWMFDLAEKVNKGSYDNIAVLGDLVDDFGETENLALYKDTLERAIQFAKDHEGIYWCLGNHDYGYIEYALYWSGFSERAKYVVNDCLKELGSVLGGRINIIHKVDNLIISHAGLSGYYCMLIEQKIKQELSLEEIIEYTNTSASPKDLWGEESPLWFRETMYRDSYSLDGVTQVVGHTPMKEVEKIQNMIMTDVFSTYRDGRPFGNQKFIIVDSITGEWGYAEYE